MNKCEMCGEDSDLLSPIDMDDQHLLVCPPCEADFEAGIEEP
jgi:ribosome-binding protein aMBF1 (putative translation factor)